jgi:hypothetical protein
MAGDGSGEATAGEHEVGPGRVPTTELGRLALAARRESLAHNRRFLRREELERAVAERRGEAHPREDW